MKALQHAGLVSAFPDVPDAESADVRPVSADSRSTAADGLWQQ